MKKLVFALSVLTVLISCKETKQENEQSENQNPEVVQAETPQLALADFDKKAGDFVNKTVEVKGIVDHVCKHGGKKLLLVTDDGDLHVTSDTRFEESLMGSEVALQGIVKEERIDEAYCLKMEEDNIKSHSEGQTSDEQFKAKKEHIQSYRDQMKANNTDHVSLYSLEYVSHKEIKEQQ